MFTKSVPHILEKIFFSLDYESFMACGKVCLAWKELHSSESYQQKADELLASKNMYIAETAPKATALFVTLCQVMHCKIYPVRMDKLNTYVKELSDRLDYLVKYVPEFEGRDQVAKLLTMLSETEELDEAKLYQMLMSIRVCSKILSRISRPH